MELWDIFNKDRNLTGRTMQRGEPFKPDEYHLVIHVCIFNSDGRMLIQHRQPFKENWSGLWDVSVGGSACAGESSPVAAMRELEEELGVKADLAGERPYVTVHFSFGFDDVYILKKDLDISQLSLQAEEVQEVKWADKGEIIQMIHEGTFIPYFPSFIELIFDMLANRDERSVLDASH